MTRLLSNTPLGDEATGVQTGTVGEPSIAANTSDQVVYRVGRLWVWLLQYIEQGGANILRIAVSRTGLSGSWRWWDLAPSDLDPSWTGVWFDYPDVGLTDEHLWLTSNVFDTQDRWVRAVIVRHPIAALGHSGPLPRQHWSTTAAGSLRCVAGAQDTMWFGSTDSWSWAVRVFAWPDASTSVTEWSVPVSPWARRGIDSNSPGGAPWLSRCDDRVTGAWRADGRLGFLWTSGPIGSRPQPFVRAVTLDEASLQVVDEPDLWSNVGAWAYPAAAPNNRGDVGMVACYGGPTHPMMAVGALSERDGGGKWGDYLTIRPDPRTRTGWVAAGYTLQGGSDRRNVEPRVVRFIP